MLGHNTGWGHYADGSRHSVPDLEPGHVGGVRPGPQRLHQADRAERHDPQPEQEDGPRGPGGEAQTGRIPRGEAQGACWMSFIAHAYPLTYTHTQTHAHAHARARAHTHTHTHPKLG